MPEVTTPKTSLDFILGFTVTLFPLAILRRGRNKCVLRIFMCTNKSQWETYVRCECALVIVVDWEWCRHYLKWPYVTCSSCKRFFRRYCLRILCVGTIKPYRLARGLNNYNRLNVLVHSRRRFLRGVPSQFTEAHLPWMNRPFTESVPHLRELTSSFTESMKNYK